MKTVVLIDTSVLCTYLDMPNFSDKSTSSQVKKEMGDYLMLRAKLQLPFATIFETGNHIAQLPDGFTRRSISIKFVDLIDKSIKKQSPFNPIIHFDDKRLAKYILEFPNYAEAGIGLGDLSIIDDYRKVKESMPNLNVIIWSLDDHLSGYGR